MLEKFLLGACVVGGGLVFAVYFGPKWFKQKLILSTFLKMSTFELEEKVVPVQKHSGLIQIAKNVWVVQGTLPQPGPSFTRAMTIFKAPGTQNLVINSFVRVDENLQKEIDDLGVVKVVIVPCVHHRLDEFEARQRFKDAKFVCPAGMFVKTADCKHKFDAKINEIANEAGFRAIDPPENEVDENVLLLPIEDQAGKHVAVFNDIMFNLNPESCNVLLRLMKLDKGFGTSAIGRIMTNDMNAHRGWFIKTFVQDESIIAAIVAHGEPVIGREHVIKNFANALTTLY